MYKGSTLYQVLPKVCWLLLRNGGESIRYVLRALLVRFMFRCAGISPFSPTCCEAKIILGCLSCFLVLHAKFIQEIFHLYEFMYFHILDHFRHSSLQNFVQIY